MRKFTLFLVLIVVCSCLSSCAKSGDNQPIGVCFIKVEYKNNVVFGSVSYSFFAKDNLKDVCFNLYPNAVSGGKGVKIKSAKQNQNDCSYLFFGRDNQFLKVELLKKVKKGKICKLELEFETQVPLCLLRLGNSGDIVNLGYFYPALCTFENGWKCFEYVEFGDPFFSDFFDVEVSLTVASNNSVACGGKVEGVKFKDEKTTYLYSLKRAKTFACSLCPNFQIVSKKWGNKRVNYYFKQDNAPQKRIDLIIDCLSFLSSICPYPYEVLTVATSPYNFGGMEYPAFAVVKENKNEKAFEYALVHEICHQYLPVCFYFNEYEKGYLDEGLAEFLAQTYFEKKGIKSKRSHALYCESAIKAIEKSLIEQGKAFSSVMNRNLNKFSCQEEYYAVAYLKGFLLFYGLEREGLDVFEALKKCYQKHSFSLLDEKILISCFSKDKKRAQKIFEQFIFG